MFDLCIEALSDKERAGIERDTVTKMREYARGGVPEYYILHLERSYRRFFALDNEGVYDTIIFVDMCCTRSCLRLLHRLQFGLFVRLTIVSANARSIFFNTESDQSVFVVQRVWNSPSRAIDITHDK